MSEERTMVGPEVSWSCPSCGEFITTRRLVGWDSLDAAWAEALRAVPHDEDGIERFTVGLESCGCGGAYAMAFPGANGEDIDAPIIRLHGDDEAKALRALAAKLREA